VTVLLARCRVCLYAGSIAPTEMPPHCPSGARIVDTAPLTFGEIEAEYVAAHARVVDVSRLHSGALSVYSTAAEQVRRLERRGIPYTFTPGVPAFAAAAAALGRESTAPELAQSLVLIRIPGRARRASDLAGSADPLWGAWPHSRHGRRGGAGRADGDGAHRPRAGSQGLSRERPLRTRYRRRFRAPEEEEA